MLGITGFSILILVCVLLAGCAPIILLGLWLKDYISKQLW